MNTLESDKERVDQLLTVASDTDNNVLHLAAEAQESVRTYIINEGIRLGVNFEDLLKNKNKKVWDNYIYTHCHNLLLRAY
jgi:hypothetical protein